MPFMHFFRLAFALIPILLLSVAGCQQVDPDDHDAAEDDDGQPTAAVIAGEVQLDANAQRAIGIQVAPVEQRRIDTTLALTGWFLAKPGTGGATRAPATGILMPGESAAIPVVGALQASGQPGGAIRVVLSPQEKAQLVIAKEEADILIQQSRVSMEIAAAQLESLRASAASGAVAQTRIKELEEIVERARVAQREAQQKLPFLPTEPYDESLGMQPMVVTSAVAGRVVDVHVQAGQFVVQGDPLWTVADWSTLWLRVPVFTGDLSRIKRDAPCRLRAGSVEVSVRPIDPPLASEPGRRTIDLYFEVENATGELRPGQPVNVALVERGEASGDGHETRDKVVLKSLVVPRSAVLWDGFGGTSVYVATGADSFRRQRVEVGEATGDGIVIERGLDDDDRIVTQGAGALHAEEFKGQIQLDDDD